MDFSFVPKSMRLFDHFVYYIDNKKIPHNPNFKIRRHAKANDPSTWGSFDRAVECVEAGQGIGIGYFFNTDDPFVGIDVDHCITKDGNLDDTALKVFKAFSGTYCEVSMSGNGLHFIIQSHIPEQFLKGKLSRKIGKFEIYEGSHYIALTGKPFISKSDGVFPKKLSPIEFSSAYLENFLRDLFPAEFETIIKPTNGKSIFDSPDYRPEYDDDLIRWLCDKVPNFSAAYERGDSTPWHGDRSVRDFFVATQLLSLFHGDIDRVANAFRNSACMRDLDRKTGHEDDYLERTLKAALEKWDGFKYELQIKSRKIPLGGAGVDGGNNEKPAEDTPQPETTQKTTQEDPFDTYKNSKDIPTVYNVPEDEETYNNFDEREKRDLFRNTDMKNAKIFVDCCESEIKYCVDMVRDGNFFRWNGTVWKMLPSTVQAWNLIQRTFDTYRDMWLTSRSESERKAIAAARNRIEMSGGIESCLSWVRADHRVQISRKDFNTQITKLNFTNKTLDLETGEITDSDRADLFTISTGYDFNPDAKSELWQKTIEQIIPDPETRDSLQCFLGYCVSGDVSAEKFAYFYGRGGNGKGTILRIMAEVLGEYSAIIPIDLFMQNKFGIVGESATPQLAKLEYARLAIADEIPDDAMLHNAKIKSATGGDLMTVRPMYSNPVTFAPQFKLILSGNVKAGFVGKRDIGIERRLLFYPFEQFFDDSKANRTLKKSLLTLENKQGIMNWLIEGYKLFREYGLFESEKMELARKRFLHEEDDELDPIVRVFVENFCIFDQKGRIPRIEFLKKFRDNTNIEAKDKDIIESLFRCYGSLDFVNYGGAKVISGIRFKKT